MMLVEHDVKPELVGELPFVVVTVEQIGRDARVAIAVEEIDPQRAGMFVPAREIRLLGELINSHNNSLLLSGLVIVREGGRSSTHRSNNQHWDYWMLRLRGA